MVDFNPAKEAIKAYNQNSLSSVPMRRVFNKHGFTIEYNDYNLTVFKADADKTINKKSSVIVNFDKDGKHYQLCDHDGDGSFDAVTIHSDKGRNIDQYFDDEDDGTFDRHSHSDTKGNHYVEHRAKWYNPMTWFKHNE